VNGTSIVFTLLSAWVWVALVVFVVSCVLRTAKWARAPEHLRWDLYPVAHEPGRDHGGSHLEQRDWWTRPRHRSHVGEISFMALEIFLLRGVWENNRKVWFGSLPFHWGMYALVLTTVGVFAAAAGLVSGSWIRALSVLGTLGGAGTAVGAFVLLVLRSTEARLRPTTAPVDRLNLVVLVVFGFLTALVAGGSAGMAPVVTAVGNVARMQPATVSPLVGWQMTVAALFLFYLPFTRMVHFLAKYFTYHKVRWDDREATPGSTLEKRLRGYLDFGVTWSADHIGGGSTWLDVATSLPEELEKKKDGE
jgi:nitrate reductase gamma subunit